MIGRPFTMLALVVGFFGQVAFFADHGRGLMPVGLRVAAHMATPDDGAFPAAPL